MAEIAICESQCVGMNVKDLKYRLRRFKQRAALILAVAEIAQAWSGAEAMAAQSFFAERMVRVCLRYGLGRLVQKRALSVPNSEEPEKGSGFFILGVGKLGAWELNYSSDIDLIVLYDEMIEHPTPSSEYSSMFIRLTQVVTQLLRRSVPPRAMCFGSTCGCVRIRGRRRSRSRSPRLRPTIPASAKIGSEPP